MRIERMSPMSSVTVQDLLGGSNWQRSARCRAPERGGFGCGGRSGPAANRAELGLDERAWPRRQLDEHVTQDPGAMAVIRCGGTSCLTLDEGHDGLRIGEHARAECPGQGLLHVRLRVAEEVAD